MRKMLSILYEIKKYSLIIKAPLTGSYIIVSFRCLDGASPERTRHSSAGLSHPLSPHPPSHFPRPTLSDTPFNDI